MQMACMHASAPQRMRAVQQVASCTLSLQPVRDAWNADLWACDAVRAAVLGVQTMRAHAKAVLPPPCRAGRWPARAQEASLTVPEMPPGRVQMVDSHGHTHTSAW